MRKAKGICSVVIALAIVLAAVLYSEVRAQAPAAEQPKFNIQFSMKDNLAMFAGKRVNVQLNSGKMYSGVLKAVGEHYIHIEKIAERDFYDALIRIEDISAVEVQVRGLK